MGNGTPSEKDRRKRSQKKRGPGERPMRRRQQPVRDRWNKILENDLAWGAILVLVGSWILAPSGVFLAPEVEVGQIATRDYLASRDVLVPDLEATAAKKERARDAVLPVYDFDYGKSSEQDEQLSRLFLRGREALALSDEAGDDEEGGDPLERVRQRLEGATSIRVSEAVLPLLMEQRFALELEDRTRTLVRTLLRGGVVANKQLLLENRLSGITVRSLQSGQERHQVDLFAYRGHPTEVAEYLEVEIGRWQGWNRNARSRYLDFLVNNIPPNVYLNLSETEARRQAAVDGEEEVFNQVRRGQVVVRKGDAFDVGTVAIMREMTGEGHRSDLLLPIAGNAMLLVLVAVGLWFGLKRSRLAVSIDAKTFGGVVLLIVLCLLLVKGGTIVAEALANSFDAAPFNSARSYQYAIPFGALALVVSLFYGRGVAVISALSLSVVAGSLVGGTTSWAILYSLTVSLGAVYALDRLKERSAVTRAGLVVGVTGMAAVLMLHALDGAETASLSSLGFDLVCAFLGGLFVAAVSAFVVPPLESALWVTTDMKLLELSDTNLPLLQRLAFEAPGSFQHSLMVAHLAKAGCEAIGANPALAYAGGLYHDIGKILRPQYFVENQHGVNPHDKLAPSMSSLIVINHVKEGVELARETGLPQPLVDAIEQHHGTRCVSFFFNRAKEQAGEGEELSDQGFRYPGPRPQNKVMGVLMYADAVEAASRTLVDPGPVSVRNLLERIQDDCLADDQLDESDLTLGDLSRVAEAFERVLLNTYHKRVDYPGFNFKDSGRPDLRVVDGRS